MGDQWQSFFKSFFSKLVYSATLESTLGETRTRLEQELCVVKQSRDKAEGEVQRLEQRNVELIGDLKQAKVGVTRGSTLTGTAQCGADW